MVLRENTSPGSGKYSRKIDQVPRRLPGSVPPVDEWLEDARAKLAAAIGEDPSAYDLEQEGVDALLELARIAAHESGERTNAPLISYLVGLAHGRHPSKTLSDLIGETVRI